MSIRMPIESHDDCLMREMCNSNCADDLLGVFAVRGGDSTGNIGGWGCCLMDDIVGSA